jgi:hypothetical protein
MRRAPRLAVELTGSLVGRVEHPVRVVDLSAVGVLLSCEALLEPGCILDLHMVLQAEPFVAKVRVIDSSVDGSAVSEGAPRALVALDFVSVSAQDQTRLRRFLEDERKRRRSADSPAQ